MFNTLTFARTLEQGGFAKQHAETLSQALAGLIDDQLATKKDLKELEYRLIIKLSAIMGTMITILGIVTKIK